MPTPTPDVSNRKTVCDKPCEFIVQSNATFSNFEQIDTYCGYSTVVDTSTNAVPSFFNGESHVLKVVNVLPSGYGSSNVTLAFNAVSNSDTIHLGSCVKFSCKFSWIADGGSDGSLCGFVVKQGDNVWTTNFGVTKKTTRILVHTKTLSTSGWSKTSELPHPVWGEPTQFGVFFANSGGDNSKPRAYVGDVKICVVHPDPTPTPTPTCNSYVTWEVRSADNTWGARSAPRDVLVETESSTLCNSDFIYAGLCGDNNYATNRGWFSNNFSSDIRNIKYTDCGGNEYEPSSVEYETFPRDCGESLHQVQLVLISNYALTHQHLHQHPHQLLHPMFMVD